ncbi:FumJ [Nitrospirillum viridazoti Y2]|uniref:TonB-dependent receptor-like protein n=1 Tax=Nitrospirillum amazonense TaxID=28077 RepID=A0A560HVJ5_9PROT|nr:TonB-dependent receptor [Nitrospirillum amazonense]EGX99488.1 FumJ [Nitrospirillum amazonense Y2]TWB50668.1 TonB-dependent receptor-like protein [Nitrospirillum amazonense]
MKPIARRTIGQASALAMIAACLAPAPAFANDGGSTGDVDTPLEEIIVTGSRVAAKGMDQPTPVTTVDASFLQAVSPKGMAEGVLELPAFNGSNSRTAGGSAANAGHTYLNLRGLGTNRNLVLLDGRRFVATQDAGAVDINLFPQLLMKRVEVVTGGASAAYGSDAIAGVTNFILDDRLQGMKGLVSQGISRYGDSQTTRTSLAGGTSFLDGKLHIIASFDFTRDTGAEGVNIGGEERGWLSRGQFLINNPNVSSANPASPSNPSLIVGDDVRFPYATNGGLITSGPFAGTQFLPGGRTAPMVFGTNRTAGSMSGGDGATPSGTGSLSTPLNSKVAFTHITYGDKDTLELFADGMYAHTYATNNAGANSYGFNATAYRIFGDNAYLPANIKAQMAPGDSFTMGRWNSDLGIYQKQIETEVYRAVAGLRGRLGQDWSWDAYYQHGTTNGDFTGGHGVITANLYNAVDAVVNPANGQVVCRSSLTNPNNGCVPINLFGAGSPSAAARQYISGSAFANQTINQDVAAGTLRGSPFATPAGDVQMAVGFEHRREGLTQDVPPLATITQTGNGARGFPASLVGTQGGYFLGNSSPVDGSYNVNEGFVEVQIPLVRDASWAESLAFNAAGRLTGYSNAGTVWTYKAGLDYAPNSDVRFRGTVSRDIRAPNLGELYLSQAQTIATVLDRQNGNAAVTAVIQLPGNPALRPEKSDTYTVGVVATPRFLPGVNLSVDYYNIDIKDAIGRLSNQLTVDQCAAGNASVCSLITRSGGSISVISTPNLNLSTLSTRGLDVELEYGSDIGDVFGEPAHATFRALGSYVFQMETTTPGSPAVDRASQTPLQATLSATFDVGPVSAVIQERVVGSRKIDSTYGPSFIANNRIGAVWYTDLNVTYRLTDSLDGLEFFAAANNLFDRDPPLGVTPFGVAASSTLTQFYDVVGLYVTAGVRFNF